MTVHPATVTLRVPQGGTLRQRFQLPIDGNGVEVYAQVWDQSKSSKLLDLSVEWISRLTVSQGEPYCVFEIVAFPTQTALVKVSGFWDLKVVSEPDIEEDYWMRGPAPLDFGYTEDP